MRASEFLIEGGWADVLTQNTIITPMVVSKVINSLDNFINQFNEYLKTQNVPPVMLGTPCGSTTYFKKDLINNPNREYGDIDINFIIPRIEGLTNSANERLIGENIMKFCEGNPNFQTKNGTNVIVNLDGEYYQVDLVTCYYENKEWSHALAPEYNVKGVLCNSIYSSMGEALKLSVNSHGIQAKRQNGELVPFRQTKDFDLVTITNNPLTWALDLVKFFGCETVSPLLKKYPGKVGEIKVQDMINSIKGISETLEMNGKLNGYSSSNELLSKIKEIYLGKINKAINSPKFDKAITPLAIEKAQKTKETLAKKSIEIAELII
jgi:hypothetical protein